MGVNARESKAERMKGRQIVACLYAMAMEDSTTVNVCLKMPPRREDTRRNGEKNREEIVQRPPMRYNLFDGIATTFSVKVNAGSGLNSDARMNMRKICPITSARWPRVLSLQV